MRIFIDIGHPAHVHYFRNFIKIMKDKGHFFFVSARNRPMIHYLLKYYDIPFFNRGKGKNGVFGKILYMFYADFILLKKAIIFKPDIFLSFASPYAAQTAWLLHRPHIAMDDTESAKFGQLFYKPFTNTFLNPSCFKKSFGQKQILFDSYMELCYLHPNYFEPDFSIKKELGITNNERYVIMRFVSWHASHDIGHLGLSMEMKHKAIKEFSKYARVFISSEGELPLDLKKYQIQIPPEKMHDALAYADLLYGESSTMSSECAVLGIPSIFHDNVGRGYTDEEGQKYNIVFSYKESDIDAELAILKGLEILTNPNAKLNYQLCRKKILMDKIDLTSLMVWFIENYPESAKIMKENPDYQDRFK